MIARPDDWREHSEPPGWGRALAAAGISHVTVVGGSGRLGSVLVRYLVYGKCSVHVLDTSPPDPMPGVRFTACDLSSRAALPAGAFRGCDGIVHLAGLHGAHLAAGVSRRRFWAVNVGGTERVLEAAVRAGVPRVVIASSTSVYGPGSAAGHPAKVLDENSPLDPEDIYDLTKVAAERLLEAATDEQAGVALRFGRFFFPSYEGYHMRKASTGLDVRDACQAVALTLAAATLRRRAYCVASDLPLPYQSRQRLGLSAPQVLEEALPGFCDLAQRRRVKVPERVGKSVDTALARAELGYRPERALDWVVRMWRAEALACPAQRRLHGLFRGESLASTPLVS